MFMSLSDCPDGGVLDLAHLERPAGNVRQALGVDQVACAQQVHQLSVVHLRYQYALEAAEYLAQIARQRPDVVEMDVADRLAGGAQVGDRAAARSERGPPADQRQFALGIAP